MSSTKKNKQSTKIRALYFMMVFSFAPLFWDSLVRRHKDREAVIELRQTLDMEAVPMSTIDFLILWLPIVMILGSIGYGAVRFFSGKEWTRQLLIGIVLSLVLDLSALIAHTNIRDTLRAQVSLHDLHAAEFAELPFDVNVKQDLMAQIKMATSVGYCKEMDTGISDLKQTYGESFSLDAESLKITDKLCTATVNLHKTLSK